MASCSGSHRLQCTIFVFRLIGVGLFIHGFFLTRTEFSRHSQCDRLPLISMSSAKNSDPGENQKSISNSSSPGVLIPTGNEADDIVLKVPHSLISEWHGHAPMEKGSCWSKPVYSRVLILIVDALRYDFLQWQEVPEMPFHNQFEFVHNLTRKEPENTAILRFIADAPTATMQRIKGLMTGTIPTFMDISSSFASDEIQEDNIIHQFSKNSAANKTSIFVGDDTWASLFPDAFDVTIPYPSFNVKDLHTVDNGVYKNVLRLLSNGTLDWKDATAKPWNSTPCDSDKESFRCKKFMMENWQLFVGHFLGVDHVGHTYSPMHTVMQEKLREMDSTLQHVVNSLRSSEELKDTLLIVFGDHGMTLSGNHGGASDEEKDAGLFMYSPRGIFAFDSSGVAGDALQIDLVPSLSTWLGLPVPHANIGGLIGGLRYSRDYSSVGNELTGSSLNSAQVAQYLLEYSKKASSMSTAQVRKLFQKLQSALDLHELYILSKREGKQQTSETNVIEAYQSFRLQSLEQFQWMWTKFNLNEMCYGVLTVLLSILLMAQGSGYKQRDYMLSYGSFQPHTTVASFCGGLLFSMSSDTKRFWNEFLMFLKIFLQMSSSLLPHSLTPRTVFELQRQIQERMANVQYHVVENSCIAYPLSGLSVWWNILWNNFTGISRSAFDGPSWLDYLTRLVSPFWNVSKDVLLWLLDMLTTALTVVVPSWVEWIDESLSTLSLLGEDVSEQEIWGISSLMPPPLACGCIVSMLIWMVSLQWQKDKDNSLDSLKKQAPVWRLPWLLKLVCCILLELRFHGLFSNSFIVAESQLVNHVLVSLLCVTLFFLWDLRQVSAVCVAIIAVSTRMTVEYVDWATDTSMQPHQVASPAQLSLGKIILAALPGYSLIVGMVFLSPVLRGRDIGTLWWRTIVGVVICHSCVVGYWMYQRLASSSSVTFGGPLHAVVNYMCRLVYLSSAVIFALVLFNFWRKSSGAISFEQSEALRKVESDKKGVNLQSGNVINVPGGTALVIVLPIFITLELMHGAGSAFKLALILVASVTSFLLLLLVYLRGKFIFSEKTKSMSNSLMESNYNLLAIITALIFHLLGMSAFFATHNRTQFSSLNFAAPFTGWDEYSFLRGALMMTLSTFGSILFPLLALSAFVLTAYSTSNKKLIWFVEAVQCHTANLQAVCACCSMAFCVIARRHLMVWSIFAPNLIFDMAFMIWVDFFFIVIRYVLPTYSSRPTHFEKDIKIA